MEGYCFRCKAPREITNAARVYMKNGKPGCTATARFAKTAEFSRDFLYDKESCGASVTFVPPPFLKQPVSPMRSLPAIA